MLKLQVPMRYWGSFSSNDDNDGIDAAKKRNGLSQTVTLVQQGGEVHELPMVLKKSDANGISAMCSSETTTDQPIQILKGDPLQTLNRTAHDDDDYYDVTNKSPSGEYFFDVEKEKRDLFQSLNEYSEGDHVLCTFSITPDELIDSILLEHMLDRIINLEDKETLMAYDTEHINFRKLVIQLCEVADARCLIQSLEHFHSRPYMEWTIDQICSEILQHSADSKLSVINICDAIKNFTECNRTDEAEIFWSALASMDRDINEHNIKFVFGILPELKMSRRVVFGILDRCLAELYPRIVHEDMIDILRSLDDCKHGHPVQIMKTITSWLCINIDGIDEISLERTMHYLTTLNYSDKNIVKSLEYLMRTEAVQITYQPLVVQILKHIRKFRILNKHILNGCSEYVVQNIDNIDPRHFAEMVCPFGELYFPPLNSNQFWQAIESYLDQHFTDIKSNAVIDIMLSAVYLQIYPVNFIDRIFNQRFIHPLQLYKTVKSIAKQRQQLKLLDAAMTLECPHFHGPFLPRHMVGDRFEFENRAKCILNDNIDVIKLIAGGDTSFTLTTIPNQLPYNSLYTIDILFHPAGWNLLRSYNKLRDRNIFVAALIHLPEHYDASQTYLLGEQQMRIRHLRKIGFKVVSLQYSMLAKLCIHRKELHDYYVEQMRKALPAIDAVK